MHVVLAVLPVAVSEPLCPQVKDVMIENIEKVLDRGERLDLLVDKTEALQGEAWAFRREAKRARRVMWWQVRRGDCAAASRPLLLLCSAASPAPPARGCQLTCCSCCCACPRCPGCRADHLRLCRRTECAHVVHRGWRGGGGCVFYCAARVRLELPALLTRAACIAQCLCVALHVHVAAVLCVAVVMRRARLCWSLLVHHGCRSMSMHLYVFCIVQLRHRTHPARAVRATRHAASTGRRRSWHARVRGCSCCVCCAARIDHARLRCGRHWNA